MSEFTSFDFNFNNDKEKYLSVQICGGLGNQLFQIATAYVNSLKHNKKLVFKTSDKLFNNYNLTRKSFWNDLFSNKLNVLSETEYKDIKFKQVYEPYNHRSVEFYLENNDNYELVGYFQSFKYFDDKFNSRNFLRHLVYSSENYMYIAYNLYNKIKNYFTKINNTECTDSDMVTMHFRRTDYILTPNNEHNNLNFDYYIKAYNIADKNNVVIFSDDIEWCKNNIKSELFSNNTNLYFVDINCVEVEFILLSLFKHNIIANSTFSLMASYISYYDTKKIIIAPKDWFSEKQKKDFNFDKLGPINEIYHKDITNII